MPPGNGSRPSSRAYSGEGVPVGWRMSGDQKPSRLSGTTGAPASLQRTQAPAIVVRQNNRPVFSQVIGQNTMQENKTVEEWVREIERQLDAREDLLDMEMSATQEAYFASYSRARVVPMAEQEKADRRNRKMEPQITRSSRTRVPCATWRKVRFIGRGARPRSVHLAKGRGVLYPLRRLMRACNSWEKVPVLHTEKIFAQIRLEAAAIARIRAELRKLRAGLRRIDQEIAREFGVLKSGGMTGARSEDDQC